MNVSAGFQCDFHLQIPMESVMVIPMHADIWPHVPWCSLMNWYIDFGPKLSAFIYAFRLVWHLILFEVWPYISRFSRQRQKLFVSKTVTEFCFMHHVAADNLQWRTNALPSRGDFTSTSHPSRGDIQPIKKNGICSNHWTFRIVLDDYRWSRQRRRCWGRRIIRATDTTFCRVATTALSAWETEIPTKTCLASTTLQNTGYDGRISPFVYTASLHFVLGNLVFNPSWTALAWL